MYITTRLPALLLILVVFLRTLPPQVLETTLSQPYLVVSRLHAGGGHAAVIGTGSSGAAPLLTAWAKAYIFSQVPHPYLTRPQVAKN